MAKNKKTSSVIITIIITLIVLAGLSFAGIKYLLPLYVVNQHGSGNIVNDIYQIAIKVFPLLIGLTLIVIASMIASSKVEEVDEDDKLPPNSYDNALFEKPSDDPSYKKEEKVESTVVSEEEEKSFVSIFETPGTESDVNASVEETINEESATLDDETSIAEEKVETVDTASLEKHDALIDAIFALVNKLDNITDRSSIADVDLPENDLDDSDFLDDDSFFDDEYVDIDDKINKLSQAIDNLDQKIANTNFSAPVENFEPIAEVVEDPIYKEFVEIECSSAERFARIEFASAKDSKYDISFASFDSSCDLTSFSEIGDVVEFENKKILIVPFLSEAEVKENLDKSNLNYDMRFTSSEEENDFESFANGLF